MYSKLVVAFALVCMLWSTPAAKADMLKLIVGEFDGDVVIAWETDQAGLDIGPLGEFKESIFNQAVSAGTETTAGNFIWYAYPTGGPEFLRTFESIPPSVTRNFPEAPGSWNVFDFQFEEEGVSSIGDSVGIAALQRGDEINLPFGYDGGQISGCIVHRDTTFEALGVTDDVTWTVEWTGTDGVTPQLIEFKTDIDGITAIPTPCTCIYNPLALGCPCPPNIIDFPCVDENGKRGCCDGLGNCDTVSGCPSLPSSTTVETTNTRKPIDDPPCDPSFCEGCFYFCGHPPYDTCEDGTQYTCVIHSICHVCAKVCTKNDKGECKVGCEYVPEECPPDEVEPARR